MKKRKKQINPYLIGEEKLNKVKPKMSDLGKKPLTYRSSFNILRAVINKGKFKNLKNGRSKLKLRENVYFIL